jgi:hypothetical protein
MSVALGERVVEVEADLGPQCSPRWRYGSGLRVGGRTVLTAAHVVEGAVTVTVRGPDKRDRAATPQAAWTGDSDRLDLALLDVPGAEDLPHVPIAVVDRDTSSGALVEGCWAVGYPAFQEDVRHGRRLVRETAHVAGYIPPLSGLVGGLISLQVTQSPRELPAQGTLGQSQWSGMSGAAVFAGDAIVGVVAEHAARRGASDITVTPLQFLSEPSSAPSNAEQWWQRLGVSDPSGLARLPAPRPQPAYHATLAANDVTNSVIPFDLETPTRGFVGRDAVLAELDRFAASNAGGYFEIVGDAGLGKTALAAEIAQRRDAIAFLTSASGGTQHAAQFLKHVSAELLIRYELDLKALPTGVADSPTVLTQFMRLAVERSRRPVWIVVDALDEADTAAPGANPLLLPPHLPAGVFVVTTRRAGALLVGPGTSIQRYELTHDAPHQIADVGAFVRSEVAAGKRLAAALDASAISVGELVAALTHDGADGNFMYVSFMLAEVAASQPGHVDLTRFPPGLTGYYDQFWARMASAQQDWQTWEQLFQPVLDRLAVAADAVSEAWLASQVGRSQGEIRARVLEPWERVLSQIEHRGPHTWRVTHRTFAEYLVDSGKVDKGRAHRAVADAYVKRLRGRYDEWDDYGLRYAAGHLAEAVASAKGAERDATLTELARLVVDDELIRRQLDAGGLAQVEDDLRRASSLLASAPMPGAGLLLVPIALTTLRLRGELVEPGAIFDAAVRGDVAGAQQILDLFADDLDFDWHAALIIGIAWLARDAAPAKAAELYAGAREQVAANPSHSRVLALVLERMDGSHDEVAPHALPLPDPATEAEAEAMIYGLAGSGPQRVHMHDAPSTQTGGYTSALDAPRLVALAMADPPVGDPLFERYVDLHGSYRYVQYRAGSLWRLLPTVIAHPDPNWVRRMLRRIVSALLAPVRGEFLEGVEIAELSLEARTGNATAAAAFDERRTTALADAARLPKGSGTRAPGQQRVGDLWALHRRRLTALAESCAHLEDERPAAIAMVAAANRIVGGFAGFTAPAYLTLAEAASIVGDDDAATDLAGRGLDCARRAAHNIRDPVNCARVTARVGAMGARWWPGPTLAELPDVVARLQRDPQAAEFSALHVVGEDFPGRDVDDLPVAVAAAATLAELAEIFVRPVAEFLQINDGYDPDELLTRGTEVNVPDPRFPALIAARLAATALAADCAPATNGGPSSTATAERLIRRLVPIAGRDSTALSTTVSRLLLATTTADAALPGELQRLGPHLRARVTDDRFEQMATA